MPILTCFIMSSQKAVSLRTATAPDGEAEPGNRIDPRRIDAGEHVGKYALPTRCLSDPAFAELADRFDGVEVADLDIAEAWPPVED